MRLINNSRLGFGSTAGRWNFPEHSLSLIVKGCYRLESGKPAASLVGDSPILDGDVIEADTCVYDSDFAYFKPRTDVLFRGSCHAPQGQATEMCQVSIGLGSMQKTLAVYGDRAIEKKLLRQKVGEPEPFAGMPLTWSRAQRTTSNPVGRSPKVDGIAPNIEYLPTSGRNKEAAGLGAILRTWKSRQDKMGSYKKGYLENRWPWFPEDFDWSHFNAAPEDQQIEGYLRGDEELSLDKLMPDQAEFRGYLPGVRARLFLNAGEEEVKDFREVELKLDTAIIDGEAGTLTLLWRGIVQVSDQDHRELSQIYLVEEALDAPGTLEDHQAGFVKQAFSVEDEEEPVDIQVEEAAAEVDEALADAAAAKQEAQLDKLRKTASEAVAMAGLDASLVDAAFAAEAAGTDPLAAIGAALAAKGMKPVDLKAAMAESQARTVALLEQQGHDAAPFLAAFEKQPLPERDPVVETAISREMVEAMHARGESLAELDLTGLDLSGIDLSGADLSSAILSGVNFDGASLGACKLVNASMPDATLREANLRGADMTAADLCNSDLSGADLSGAILKDVDATGASFCSAKWNDAKAQAICLHQAELEGCDFGGCDFSSADFSLARLDNAEFTEAVLSDASFEGATGKRIDFNLAQITNLRADETTVMPDATFIEVSGQGVCMSGAQLRGAQFVDAKLQGALFVDSRLEDADFDGSDIRQANFTKADLSNSSLRRCNGMQASFERANLSEADLSQSNFYEAEFLDTLLSGAQFAGAFLAGSKLAGLREAAQ